MWEVRLMLCHHGPDVNPNALVRVSKWGKWGQRGLAPDFAR
jgi:hypothetical protein